MLAGDRRALSRLLTLIESEPLAAAPIMASVHSRTGRAVVIGVTGPPGAGKSTLIDALVTMTRARGRTAGVIAVDPTSTISGGAVLGDRIRMSAHHDDEGVYVRSLSTRGSHGGLSALQGRRLGSSTHFGFDTVFLESVGVGQTELDVTTASDSVVVALVPEAGDAVQTMKAGLMEIGDIYIINKADRDGADRLAAAVKAEVRAATRDREWTPPVLMTKAHRAEGIDALLDAIQGHIAHLSAARVCVNAGHSGGGRSWPMRSRGESTIFLAPWTPNACSAMSLRTWPQVKSIPTRRSIELFPPMR